MQRLEPFVILYQIQCGRDQLVGCVGIADEDGSVFVDQRHGVMGLVILRHIRRGNQDRRFAQQA